MCSKLKFNQGAPVPAEKLELGKIVTFPTSSGFVSGKFAGNMKSERWKSYWKTRIRTIHVVPINGFSEGKGRAAINFNVKKGAAVIVGQLKNGELRIATQPAAGGVEKVHDRMPFIVAETYQPKLG